MVWHNRVIGVESEIHRVISVKYAVSSTVTNCHWQLLAGLHLMANIYPGYVYTVATSGDLGRLQHLKHARPKNIISLEHIFWIYHTHDITLGNYIYCIHVWAPSEANPMNTNMTGFKWFSKIVAFLCFG